MRTCVRACLCVCVCVRVHACVCIPHGELLTTGCERKLIRLLLQVRLQRGRRLHCLAHPHCGANCLDHIFLVKQTLHRNTLRRRQTLELAGCTLHQHVCSARPRCRRLQVIERVDDVSISRNLRHATEARHRRQHVSLIHVVVRAPRPVIGVHVRRQLLSSHSAAFGTDELSQRLRPAVFHAYYSHTLRLRGCIRTCARARTFTRKKETRAQFLAVNQSECDLRSSRLAFGLPSPNKTENTDSRNESSRGSSYRLTPYGA